MATNKQQDKQVHTMAANENALTDAPGTPQAGIGVGAAGGALVGAAMGTGVAGPLGGLAGATIGAVAGGLFGKGAAEAFDPTLELDYWRDAYVERPYYDSQYTFDSYEPAYRYGWESKSRMIDKDWDDVEGDLERDWSKARGNSSLSWEGAKEAVRDAWDRLTGDTPTPPRKHR